MTSPLVTGIGALAGALLILGIGTPAQRVAAGGSAGMPPACVFAPPPPGSAPGPPALSRAAPTAVTTVGQAYFCILDHYAAGPELQDQSLLQGATEGLVSYLLSQDLDQPDAYLPPLSDDRAADWQTFTGMYAQALAALPQDAATQSALAVATIGGMVDSLHDNHTSYLSLPAVSTPAQLPLTAAPPPSFGLFVTRGAESPDALPSAGPVEFVTDVWPAGSATKAGLQPGDVVTAVDGQPPVRPASPAPVAAMPTGPTDPTTAWQQQAGANSVRVSVYRPVSGDTFTVELDPQSNPSPLVVARTLPDGAGYVKVFAFSEDTGPRVLDALNGLGASPRGLVRDLRGNRGGSGTGVEQLLGLFVHGAVISSFVDGYGNVIPQVADDSMPLLNQPPIVLIDHASVSGADAAAAAMRDLGLGRLVGERTGGIVAGAGIPYSLDDGSVLLIDTSFARGADGEILDGIGVPPNDETPPPTAADLSAGEDPGIVQAMADLAGDFSGR